MRAMRSSSSLARGTTVALVTALVTVLAACRRPPPPELPAARSELAARAVAVCAAPASRPPHRPSSANVKPSDAALREALLAVCEQGRGEGERACDGAAATSEPCRAVVAAADKYVQSARERLTDDRPVVALLRRSELLVSAPPVNMEKLSFDAAVAVVAAASSRPCELSRLGLEKLMLAAARQASAARDDATAMALCADVAALERDRFLVGDMTDAMMGVAALALLDQTCRPLAEAAPDAVVAPLRAATAVIRKGCPAALDDAMQRDLDEVFLVTLGVLRDESVLPPCDRAKRLLERSPRATTNAELQSHADAYRAYKNAPRPERAKYDAEYAKALGILDRFVTVRGR